MRSHRLLLLLIPSLLGTAAAAQCAAGETTVKLPCVADTNVSSYPSERGFNYGHSSRLRLKGIEMLMLARFDTAPVRDWRVTKAVLMLHAAGPNKLRTIGISTIAVDWGEGDGSATSATSGATFEWAEVGKRRWAGGQSVGQSDVTDAIFTRLGTEAFYTDLRPRDGDWMEIDVPARFVEAMARGLSHGLAITDEKGQTYANNDVHSREQSGFGPYLVVTGEPGPVPPPSAVPRPAAPLSAVGPVASLPRIDPITWARGQPPVRDGALRVWAYGECEKASPVTGNLLEEVGAEAIGKAPAGDYRQRNSVWEGASSTIHLAGGRNEFVACNLCVEALRPPLDAVRLTVADLTGPQGSRLPAAAIRMSWDWSVRDGEWYPEVAIPLSGPLTIPNARNAIPGQRNQSVLMEIYIPHDARPGTYRGQVEVAAQGVKPFPIPVELTVSSMLLPDKLSFQVDLNAYGAPGDAAMELKFHRMAHEHRATLNILGYYQSGNPDPAYVPPLEGTGKNLHVKDWSAFDRRFGPYFDGSAFADLPRARVPLSHGYLPFCEGWPSRIAEHYHYTPTVTAYPEIIAEHALKAPPIAETFDQTYRDEFQAVVREFARHFREKGWDDTEFQLYFNDKYYFRDPKQGGRGSSWWLLDEPMHRDDWLALRYFGTFFKQALAQTATAPNGSRRAPGAIREPKWVFRADISRPQWQRDWLDGLVDLMCVSGEFFQKNELCMNMHRDHNIAFWHYGTGNDIRATNLTGEAWAVKVYLAGGDGLLPWDSLGGDASFDQPTPTTILYPGGRFGISGPLASLRLKAFRRGQQDVEYLALLARQRGWSREQLAAAVAPLLDLKGSTRARFVDDAGTPLFERLTSEQFARIRASIAKALGS